MVQPANSPSSAIFAWATPPGRSAVAILRLSGNGLAALLAHFGIAALPAPRIAALANLHHPENGAAIDQALLLYFPAPHSYTGEEVVELHCHGSRAVIAELTGLLLAMPGVRQAEPGEFTRRALLNGKLDLLEAEAVADLIDAETSRQRTQALHQLGGMPSAELEGLRAGCLHAMALMEAYIDFPDEEIPESALAESEAEVAALRENIRRLLGDGRVGERIREGIGTAIIGLPNAGKSSLLNALARREVAIVTPHAGTTRDALEVAIDLGGMAVQLVDTAGIRDSADPVEQEGIRRARTHAEGAELRLLMIEASSLLEAPQEAIAPFRDYLSPSTLILASKTDLLPPDAPSLPASVGGCLVVPVSVQRGELTALMDCWQAMAGQLVPDDASPIITRAIHRQHLQEALAALERFHTGLPLELMAEELRSGAHAIAKITGRILVDELLDIVFSSFCIGK